MPRKRQTLPPEVAPEQTYGQGADQMAQQAEIPLPDNQAAAAPPPAAGPGPAAQQLAQSVDAPPPNPQQAVDLARALPFSSMDLGGATQKMSEPITAGSPLGAGVGPEGVPTVMGATNREADLLDLLAQTSGNPQLSQMAMRLRGGG